MKRKRPNFENYKWRYTTQWKYDVSRYRADVEKYCDELENKIDHLTFMIGETLVEHSKLHIKDSVCIEKIRNYLCEFTNGYSNEGLENE